MSGLHWGCLVIGFLLGAFFGGRLLSAVGVKAG